MKQLCIVIPARNEAQQIGQLLGDLQTLRSVGAEILLVDGGSEDDTVAVGRPMVDKVLYSEPGRARQLNKGLAEVGAEWVWFLHADTRVSAGAVAALSTQLQDDHVAWGRFDVRIVGAHPMLKVVAWFMNRRSCWTGIATGDQGIFVRKALCEAIGGVPDLELMEDVELSRRLYRLTRPACITAPLLTSGRRWEARGVFRTIVLMWCLRFAWFAGLSDKTLARWYR